jgi:hypothetical protein
VHCTQPVNRGRSVEWHRHLQCWTSRTGRNHFQSSLQPRYLVYGARDDVGVPCTPMGNHGRPVKWRRQLRLTTSRNGRSHFRSTLEPRYLVYGARYEVGVHCTSIQSRIDLSNGVVTSGTRLHEVAETTSAQLWNHDKSFTVGNTRSACYAHRKKPASICRIGSSLAVRDVTNWPKPLPTNFGTTISR